MCCGTRTVVTLTGMTTTFLMAVHLWRKRGDLGQGLKWSSADRQMAQFLRARTVSNPHTHHLTLCPAQPICGRALRGRCGPPGLTGWPGYSVYIVLLDLNDSEVHHSRSAENPLPTLIQGAAPLKVSEGVFPFFLSKYSGVSVSSCHGYSKVSDHLWACFWCKKAKRDKSPGCKLIDREYSLE